MRTVTVTAHFDGEQIHLDEPFNLPQDTPLLVTIFSVAEGEIDQWMSLSRSGLARAYAEDEDEYPLDRITKPNPTFSQNPIQ